MRIRGRTVDVVLESTIARTPTWIFDAVDRTRHEHIVTVYTARDVYGCAQKMREVSLGLTIARGFASDPSEGARACTLPGTIRVRVRVGKSDM